MKTGVCYYPEHWPESQWADDARRMRKIGIGVVRIGEFAWSRLESRDGELHFEWLQRAMDTLHDAGLSIVLGTPTATPPRWMLDKHPDMLAVDAQGRVRDFGSRRHYCFSSEAYREECKRIVTLLAECFGKHPGLTAWQTDNEYGCHSTSISYSAAALAAFQSWCERRYGTIETLNEAWGNVFWSMEYDQFSQIGLPTGTVTEANPAHQLAFWRFSSHQIRRFNQAQADILRTLSPGRDILHNFMGNFVEFDHHDVSRELDIATWDNYPLGFLTRDNTSQADQERFYRTGHPDGSAFHHDLYRGCCRGRWWVMEQQPGPVNWAPYNPSPLPGMVRLWGWEAFAHGAEVMSYFRWRQAPFAQEQTHTGLLLPNGADDVALGEVTQLNDELARLAQAQQSSAAALTASSLMADPYRPVVSADVAIVFSYAGIAIQDIQPPGGCDYSALNFAQRVHSACRQWGVNVDILSPDASLDGYKLIILCTSTEDDAEFVDRLEAAHQTGGASIVLFPGTGSRTDQYSIPKDLAPGHFRRLIDVCVTRSESLPPQSQLWASADNGQRVRCQQWREHLISAIAPQAIFDDGWGYHYSCNNVHYINAIPVQSDLIDLIGTFLNAVSLPARNLGACLRIQRVGSYCVAFNYGAELANLDSCLGPELGFYPDTQLIIGSRELEQAEVAVWVVT